MAITTSQYMSLPVPVVGGESGPQFAVDINSCMSIIDGHNHTPGSGVQIPPAGLNINTALSFQGNAATSVGSVGFTAGSLLTAIDTVYVNGVDLYYTDGNGNQIQITKAGIVNTIASSIPGESYSGGTFIWKQGSGSTTPAFFDIASVTIRPATAGTTYGVTVNPPSAIASAYGIYLPAIPGSTSFLTIDTGGNIVGSIATSGGITGSNIANATITGSNIASATITAANLANNAVTPPILSAANYAIGSSTGTITTTSTSPVYTGSTATITASGVRPILIFVQSANANSPAYTFVNENDPGNLYIYKDGSVVAAVNVGAHTGSTTLAYDAPLMMWFDPTPTAGSHAYALYYSSAGVFTELESAQIVAIEL